VEALTFSLGRDMVRRKQCHLFTAGDKSGSTGIFLSMGPIKGNAVIYSLYDNGSTAQALCFLEGVG